jgi:ABC-2 type transport system ATP-binding protein
MSLEVQDVVRSFDGQVVVDHVSFKVEKGECFGLLGPNGAGKTTLIKVILGLLQPDQGRIFINGMDVHKNPGKVKPLIGACFQENILYGDLNGWENLEFIAALYRVPRKNVREAIRSALDRVLLEEKDRKKLVKFYSGGMKRKLSLASALVNNPSILLLDEPTTGLDPKSRRAVWDAIETLKHEGRTVLLTTHYMEEADVLSDRVAIIDEGKIIVHNTPEALKNSLGKSVIEVLCTTTNDAFLKDAEKISGVSAATPVEGGYHLLSREPNKVLSEVVTTATSHQLGLESVKISSPTLEDVFLKLTGKSLREE